MKRVFKVSGYIIAFLGYLLFGFLSWLNLCLATGAPWVEYSGPEGGSAFLEGINKTIMQFGDE